MPKDFERKLIKEAKAKHLVGRRFDAYVYGTLYRVMTRHRILTHGHHYSNLHKHHKK